MIHSPDHGIVAPGSISGQPISFEGLPASIPLAAAADLMLYSWHRLIHTPACACHRITKCQSCWKFMSSRC